MRPSLVPDSLVLLREVTVENHVNVMEGEITRLGDILGLINESDLRDIT